MPSRVKIPQHAGRLRRSTKKFVRHDPKKPPTPVRLHGVPDEKNPSYTRPVTLYFEQRRPRQHWIVPPVLTPLYWFDRHMVTKGLITPIPPDIFVCDGRRFKVLAQEQHVIGIGYTRWLVYEEHPALPNKGKP